MKRIHFFLNQYWLMLKILTISFLLCISHLIIAQKITPCGNEHFENLIKNDVSVQKKRMEMERFTEAFRKSSGSGRSDSIEFIIPIVFHVESIPRKR
jgi:hypothetical protein